MIFWTTVLTAEGTDQKGWFDVTFNCKKFSNRSKRYLSPGRRYVLRYLVEDIEKKYAGKIKFCEVEIEESAVLAAEYAPEIVPTFVLFKDKKAISVMGGMVDEHTFESRMLEILS